MALASGSRHSLAFIVESTFGTTPSTPALAAIRNTGTTLELKKTILESNEIRSDRQVTDIKHGNKKPAGDINIELSYGTFDDFLEALLGGTWATDTPSAGIDQLEAGTIRRFFTIERFFADVVQYHRFTGCSFNTLSLSVKPDAIVSGTFGILAKGTSIAQAIIAGATYPAASTTTPFDSFAGTINEGGSAIAVVTSIDLNIDNGMGDKPVVGSDESLEHSIGKSRVTGTAEVFFEDEVLLNKFVNETESSMDFTLVDTAGNQYYFNFPRIKYTTGAVPVSDDGDVTVTMEFMALLDSGEGTNIQIERNPI